ncbi:MAG TPA: CoA transferase [Burkholderiales bacterium]
MKPLLEGIRVVDFGRYIAGPYCAALLADHGADVIRVERREGGEDRAIPNLAKTGEGGLFLQMNRGKRCLTLDLAHREARGIIRRLAETADVVVVNLPPPTLAKLGLDWETLSAVNPRLVMVLGTAYGSSGPYAERPGFDAVGQAMSGAMYLSGDDTRPARSSSNYVDFTTALALANGALAALWAREKTGRGQKVEGSLLRSALVAMNAVLIEQAILGNDRPALGNRGFLAAPADTYRTRDGWVLVQTLGKPMFDRWCDLVGQPELKDDPGLATDPQRGARGAEISAIMAAWCATRTRSEVLAALDAARLPAAPVYTPRETLADPHVVATGLLGAMTFGGLEGSFPLAPHPVEMSASPVQQGEAPRLGEHTDVVLAELGYDAAAIAALRANRVI